MDSHFYDPVVLYVLPGPNQIQMLKLRYYERFDENSKHPQKGNTIQIYQKTYNTYIYIYMCIKYIRWEYGK